MEKKKIPINQYRCARYEHPAVGGSRPVVPAPFVVGRSPNRLGRSPYRFCPAGSDSFGGMCAEHIAGTGININTVALWIVFCKYCSHRIPSPYDSIDH